MERVLLCGSMIGVIVILATAGDVLIASAIRQVGDFDQIRAHSGLEGAIASRIAECAVFVGRGLHGAELFLAAVRAQLGGCQPGRSGFGSLDIRHQCFRGEVDSEGKCGSPAMAGRRMRMCRGIFSGAVNRALPEETASRNQRRLPYSP